MYTDQDFNFSSYNPEPQYRPDYNYGNNNYPTAKGYAWNYDSMGDQRQRHVSFDDPDRIRLNEFANLPGYSYHGELHGPSDIYHQLKESSPVIPAYTRVSNDKSYGERRKPAQSRDFFDPQLMELIDLISEYCEEPAREETQKSTEWDVNSRERPPCRCGVDENWVGELPENMDICRASCCRQVFYQSGAQARCFPKGSCRSPQCPRVSDKCYTYCRGTSNISCYDRYPGTRVRDEPKKPLEKLDVGQFIGCGGGGGGAVRDGGQNGGRGSRDGTGGGKRERGKSKTGGKRGHGGKGKDGGGERVLKVTDYEGGAGAGGFGGGGGGRSGSGGRGSNSRDGGGGGRSSSRDGGGRIGSGKGGRSGDGGRGGSGIDRGGQGTAAGRGGQGSKDGSGPGGMGPGGVGEGRFGPRAGSGQGFGRNDAFGRGREACPGPRPLCPGPRVCKAPSKPICPGPKKVCGANRTSERSSAKRAGGRDVTQKCPGPRKCGGPKSAPPVTCRGVKK